MHRLSLAVMGLNTVTNFVDESDFQKKKRKRNLDRGFKEGTSGETHPRFGLQPKTILKVSKLPSKRLQLSLSVPHFLLAYLS